MFSSLCDKWYWTSCTCFDLALHLKWIDHANFSTWINCSPVISNGLLIITKLSIVNPTNMQWVAVICNAFEITQLHSCGIYNTLQVGNASFGIIVVNRNRGVGNAQFKRNASSNMGQDSPNQFITHKAGCNPIESEQHEIANCLIFPLDR